MKEKYLGLVKIIGSKSADALCQKICDILHSKDFVTKQHFFYGLSSNIAMSAQHTGLQHRFKHEAQHSKYVNC